MWRVWPVSNTDRLELESYQIVTQVGKSNVYLKTLNDRFSRKKRLVKKFVFFFILNGLKSKVQIYIGREVLQVWWEYSKKSSLIKLFGSFFFSFLFFSFFYFSNEKSAN